jgi:hypothetical protein
MPCRRQGGQEIVLVLDLNTRWGEQYASRFARTLPLYLSDTRLGGPQSWSGHMLEETSFASTGDRMPVVQSRHCTDGATPEPYQLLRLTQPHI